MSESDIQSSVERSVLEAERNVRKRKAAVMQGGPQEGHRGRVEHHSKPLVYLAS